MNQPSLFENQVFPPIKPIAYGLPYQGSKRAIAFEVMKTMHRMKPNAKYFYDLFGGGGATMSYMALQWGYTVFYNEFDTGIYNLVTFLKNNPVPLDWWEPVTREQFKTIKDLNDPKSVAQSLCWSFSNNRRGYLWGKHIEQIKLDLYRKYISLFPGRYIPSIYKNLLKKELGANTLEENNRLQSLERMESLQSLESLQSQESLQSLQSLQRLERLERLERLQTSNLSFEQVVIKTPPEETIIYLDPPYRGTTGYKTNNSVSSEFTALVDKYMGESKYTVFMSEYKAPFPAVAQFKRKCLMAGAKTKQTNTERLFWNGR